MHNATLSIGKRKIEKTLQSPVRICTIQRILVFVVSTQQQQGGRGGGGGGGGDRGGGGRGGDL